MSKITELVEQYGTRCRGSGVALEGCNFGLCGEEAARANIIKAEIANKIAALEEKERALEWLLENGYAKAKRVIFERINLEPYKCYVVNLTTKGDMSAQGSGPTPLDAVLDAMKKEVG